MAKRSGAGTVWVRRLFGNPTLGFGIVWGGLGVAWFLNAVLSEPTATRIVLGSLWLLLGSVYCVFAVRDRRSRQGAYAPTTPTPAPAPASESSPAEADRTS